MKRKRGRWQRELLGWDDGGVYVHCEDRGNFSIKRHADLHRKLVDLAIQYFEQHNAESEEELVRMTPRKHRDSSNIFYKDRSIDPNRCGVFNMLIDPSSPNSIIPATELARLKITPQRKTSFLACSVVPRREECLRYFFVGLFSVEPM